MQQTSENAALDAWQSFSAKHPGLHGRLMIIGSFFGFFLNGHFIVALVRWMVRVAGYVAESALMLATLYVSCNYVAHELVTWILPDPVIGALNYISLVAFSLLPELIVATAINVTLDHWLIFFRGGRKWRDPAWIWGVLYTVPTSIFIVMTLVTLFGFVEVLAVKGTPVQASGPALVVRVVAGYWYALIEILWTTIGKKGYARVVDGLRATLAEVRATMATRATELDGLRATVATHAKELRATIARATQAEEGLRATELEATQARATMATIAQEMKELRATRAMEGAEERATMATELDGLRTAIAMQATELDRLRSVESVLSEREEELRAMELRATQAEEERATLSRSLQTTKATVARLRGRMAITDITEEPQPLALEEATGLRAIPEERATGYEGEATGYESRAMVARSSEDGRATGTRLPGYDGSEERATAGYVARADGATDHRGRIKAVMLAAVLASQNPNYAEIAERAGTGYSTVKKHAKEIKEEISQELRHGK